MGLGLGQNLELKHKRGLSLGTVCLMELTHEQVYELVGDILAEVVSGAFVNEATGNGNYFDSRAFTARAKQKFDNGDVYSPPEFAVASNLSVQRIELETREKIVEALSRLKLSKPMNFPETFSGRLLESLDWVMGARQRIIEALVDVQSEYILDFNDKFKLRPQSQVDLGRTLGLSVPTVCRLVKSQSVSLPDQSAHPISSLIPGYKIDTIKGEYCLSLLKDNPTLYAEEGGWKVGSHVLAMAISDRFGINYAPRTIRKYLDGLGEPRAFAHKKGAN